MAYEDEFARFEDGSIPEDYPISEDDVDFEGEEDDGDEDEEPLDDYGSVGQFI